MMLRRQFLKSLFAAGAAAPFAAEAWEKKPFDYYPPGEEWPKADWEDVYRPNELICVKPSVQPLASGVIGLYWRTACFTWCRAEVSQDGGATWTEIWHNVDGIRQQYGQVFTAVYSKYDMTKPLKYRVTARPIEQVGTWGEVRFYGEEWIAGKIGGYYPPKNYRGQIHARLEKYTGEESVAEGELKAVDPLNFDVCMVNDVHHTVSYYPELLKRMSDKTVLTVFAGDICDHSRSPDDFYKHLSAPMSYVSRKTKGLVAYCRGNHETMGIYGTHVRDHVALYRPLPLVEALYGAYTIGNTRLVFIDTANDVKGVFNPKSPHDLREDMEGYFADQAQWLESEFASDAWKGAKNRVCFSHIPWGYGPDTVLTTQIMPLVAKAGVTLYCAGHEHNAKLYPKDVPFGRKGERVLPYDLAVGGGPRQKPKPDPAKPVDPKKPKPAVGWPTVTTVSVRNGELSVSCVDIEGEKVF